MRYKQKNVKSLLLLSSLASGTLSHYTKTVRLPHDMQIKTQNPPFFACDTHSDWTPTLHVDSAFNHVLVFLTAMFLTMFSPEFIITIILVSLYFVFSM